MRSRHPDPTARRRFLRTALGAAIASHGASRVGAAAAQAPAPGGPTPALAPPARGAVKITGLSTYRLPDAIFVKVETDAGVAGWGECSSDNRPLMETFVHHGLKEEVLGRDPFDAEPLWDRMFFENHDLGPGGALPNAMAGIDLALWDLKGRLLGLPVHKLIGGAYRTEVRAYGSFGVGFGRRMTSLEAARTAARFVEKGLTAVKVRMQIREHRQNPEPEPTFEYVKAVRGAIGDGVELIVDANNGYTAARAIEVGKRLAGDFGIRYLEDPCSDQNHRETAQVVEALDLYVIAGEKEYTRWQIADLITQGNPDFLNPDPIKVGGLTEMKKIAAVAQAFSKPIICHNTRPTLATAASLQFVASIPNCGPFLEFPDTDSFGKLMGAMRQNVDLRGGSLLVPRAPGLGLDVDEEAVRRLALSIQ
jgi:L-alanine-DL-glutamate epimerase-like enolase superfamily enzyme